MGRIQLALNVSGLDSAVQFYGEGVTGALNHVGVEVERPAEVAEAAGSLGRAGLAPRVQDSTTWCYAVQDKVWVGDPDGVLWEVYTVLADAANESGLAGDGTCCSPSASSSCC